MDRRKRKRVIASIFVIIWMGVIFAYSAQTGGESSTTSMSASYRLVEATGRALGANWQDSEILSMAVQIEGVIRKLAHMIEYAILSVSVAYALEIQYRFEPTKRSWLIRMAGTLLLCFVYAITDEIHQLFVPGRHGAVRDVLIDSLGALVAFIILNLIIMIKEKKKQ